MVKSSLPPSEKKEKLLGKIRTISTDKERKDTGFAKGGGGNSINII